MNEQEAMTTLRRNLEWQVEQATRQGATLPTVAQVFGDILAEVLVEERGPFEEPICLGEDRLNGRGFCLYSAGTSWTMDQLLAFEAQCRRFCDRHEVLQPSHEPTTVERGTEGIAHPDDTVLCFWLDAAGDPLLDYVVGELVTMDEPTEVPRWPA